MKTSSFTIAIVMALLLPRVLLASEEGDHFHKNHVAIFLGNTTDYHGENAFTVGAEYEYRLSRRWGAVGLVDYAGDKIDVLVLAAGAMFHGIGGLRLQAAPGLDIHNGKSEFVVRFGALYDFHLGQWVLSPSVYVDVLELKQNLIYGFGFGRGF